MSNNLVGMGQIQTAKGPTILKALALGSCIGIAIWDSERKIGSLAHAILPKMPENRNNAKAHRYAATAINIMLDQMQKLGSKTPKDKLEAKLVGGANMFPNLHSIKVGERNTKAARTKLNDLRIPIVAEDIGKNFGRTVNFNCQDGSIEITTAGGKLWKKI
ncbi:MAG: chemotaxis protein CheD [Candidatus Heimdallarchaeota archaeon]